MSVYVIVPVKPIPEGKSRLAASLSDGERMALNRAFLARTLRLTAAFPGPDKTIVVSRCDEALAAARAAGMIALAEPPGGDLNAAVAFGADHVLKRGGQGMLYVPVDLPFATVGGLRAAVAAATPPCLVVVPDRRQDGTNMLFQSPVRMRSFAFGKGSFGRHAMLGAAAGLPVTTVHIRGLSFDVDDQADLSDLRNADRSPPCAARLSGLL